MRKEYNLKQLKVKRRGVLPEIQEEPTASQKVRITIALDKDVVEHFKAEAKQPGSFPYQTQINQALRQVIRKWHGIAHKDYDEIKDELLHDASFLHDLAGKISKEKNR